jgi:hypothetical protein
MNRISLKKLNEGLQAEFSISASEAKNRVKTQDINPGNDNNELSVIEWIEENKDIFNNF